MIGKTLESPQTIAEPLLGKPSSAEQQFPLIPVLGLGWAMIVLALATYHLGLYPTTWFDEGSHLHVPETLVRYGVYADLSSDGFRYFGPTIGVGPTVLLPIALIFKVAGIGLVQARLVIVAYLLAAVALTAVVARRFYGPVVALLAVVLLSTTPSVGLIVAGRQVVGEVPSLAFFLAGLWCWTRSLEPEARRSWLLAASLMFGLSAVTKNETALILGPTMVVVGLADLIYYRQARITHYLVLLLVLVGAVVAEYAFVTLPVIQTSGLTRMLVLWRDASAGAIFVFAPARMLSSLKLLTSGAVYAFWGLPAILYAALQVRDRSRQGLQAAFVWIFVVLGLLWYAFGSIGWPRYAFTPLALDALFVAKLLADLVGALGRQADAVVPLRGRAVNLAIAGAVLAIALMVVSPMQALVSQVAGPGDQSPQEMAAYLDAHVPASAVVESWEPELGFLSDRRIHYPPSGWLDRAVRAKWLGATNLMQGYDPIAEAHPAYLVVGPFGRYSGIYAPLLARLHEQPIISIGDYDLYKIPQS